MNNSGDLGPDHAGTSGIQLVTEPDAPGGRSGSIGSAGETVPARLERLAAAGMFAMGVAHELISPLSTIRMAAAFALEGVDSERHRQTLDVILEASERCRRIVEGVMRFVQDEVVQKWPADVEVLVRRALNVVQADVGAPRLVAALEFDPTARLVPCNASALEQVFVNLFRNAVQASLDECRLTIRSYTENRKLAVSVADEGTGIPEADLERVFEPFYSTRRDKGGTGLGLALVRRIVAAHGGSIVAVAAKPRGATFVLELPLE
jgi:signal transduction histidine kinase